jgi:hypothetical protein
MLNPERPLYALHATRALRDPVLRDVHEAIGTGERYLAVLRSHPDYAAPESVRDGFRRLLEKA